MAIHKLYFDVNNKLVLSGTTELPLLDTFKPKFTYSNLIGYWKFDNNIIESISGVTMTTSGDQTYATGKKNEAISYPDADSFIKVSGTTKYEFQNTDPFSFAFWVKRNQLNVDRFFFNKNVSTGGYQLEVNFDGKLLFYIGGGTAFQTTVTIENTDWNHVAVTYDGVTGGTGVNIYINGTEAGTISGSPITNLPEGGELYIGNWRLLTHGCLSILDEFGIWGAELSEGEISDLYNDGVGTFY